MWSLNTDWHSPGAFARYAKNHEREYESCFTNLDKIMVLLNSGNKLGGFQIGFFRSEGEGVWRIGQTGIGGSKETRLYVYPDAVSEIMYILEIGSKDSQQRDIGSAKESVRKIKGHTNEHNTHNERG